MSAQAIVAFTWTKSGAVRRFVHDVTSEEQEFGFGHEDFAGVRAVVRVLGAGLRAVKVQAEDGSAEYAVCDESLCPLYVPAKTLDELHRRFDYVFP